MCVCVCLLAFQSPCFSLQAQSQSASAATCCMVASLLSAPLYLGDHLTPAPGCSINLHVGTYMHTYMYVLNKLWQVSERGSIDTRGRCQVAVLVAVPSIAIQRPATHSGHQGTHSTPMRRIILYNTYKLPPAVSRA